MEVSLRSELEAALSQIAAAQGRDAVSLILEAVEHLVDYDRWFITEVEKGLAAADDGQFLEHDDIGKLIDSRFPG